MLVSMGNPAMISIIVPMYNEEANVVPLKTRLDLILLDSPEVQAGRP